MIRGSQKEEDDIPWLGRNSSAPYCAYGDDTKYEDILLYAFIIIDRAYLSDLENEFQKVKSNFNIPDNTEIHIKDFLNKHQRKKLNLEDLNVPKFIDSIIEVINNGKCAVIFNFTQIPEDGNILPKNLEISGEKIHGDHRSLIHMLGASCFVPFLLLDGKYLTLKDMEVFVSQESTKVKTIGNSRRQAQYLSEMMIPTTKPIQKGSYARLKPHYVLTRDNMFCQIADVIAYVLSHALSAKCKDMVYKKQYKSIKYVYQAPAGFN